MRGSRRSGRTFEGALALMAVCVVAAVVIPPLVRPDRGAPPEAACLAVLAGRAVGAVASDVVCPLSGAGATAAPLPRGGLALSCPGQHERPVPRLVVEAGTCRIDQHLGRRDLPDGAAIDTGALLTTTTARREGDRLVLTTRPAAWVRAVGAPLLALLSLGLATIFVTEEHTGWRPGGAPPPPGRLRFAAKVAAIALLNPLGLGAVGLLGLDARVEAAPGRVTARAAFGDPAVFDHVLGVALLGPADGPRRLVVVHRPDAGAPPACDGLLTLAPADGGAAGEVAWTVTRSLSPAPTDR